MFMPERNCAGNFQSIPYSCWIDGEERGGGDLYSLVDPSTGEVFAQALSAGGPLIDSALESARAGLKIWRSTPAPRRAQILHNLADLIRRQREELASLVCLEVGKPLKAAMDEVLNAASLIDFFAEESLRLTGRIPLMGYSREQVMIVREPVGVVVAITPFNYPLSTLACKMGAALSVGCSLVAKPDEHTPLATLALGPLALEAGMPAGVFNVVTGEGTKTGRMLVEHAVPRLVTFTGSTQVGKEIQAVSAGYVRKTILELGGNCPAIVCADAPWRELLPKLVMQSLKNSGQYCYRTSRIYVADSIYEDFLNGFLELAKGLRVGDPKDPDVQLGPLNNADTLERVQSQVEEAARAGARIECGGSSAPFFERGFYYPPTVLTGVESHNSIVQEEVFGPVVVISRYSDTEEAIEEANGTPFGLAAYLFTNDLANALEWSNRLEFGSVWINRIHQAYPEAPFGGMKESGLGREKSSFGLEEYTELKTIYLSY